MNRIQNAISSGNRPIQSDVWIIKKGSESPISCNELDNEIEDGDLPVLIGDYSQEAVKVWNLYFRWLFEKTSKSYSLITKLEKNRAEINNHFPALAGRLFNGDKVNKDGLIEILLAFPETNADRSSSFDKLLDINENRDDLNKLSKTDRNAFLKPIAKTFDYDFFSKRPSFNELVQMLDVNVCPYCGRAFTGTAKADGDEYIRANQVDHFYPKSFFPHLSLSLWNLIPSCSSCNLKKHDNLKTILYPYTESMRDEFRFRTHPVKSLDYIVGKKGANDYTITLEAAEDMDPDRKARAEYQIKSLGLDALYSLHKGYVADIFRQRYVFGDDYIDSILHAFPDLFSSKAEVKALLYMKSIEKDDIGRNPLDKLTRDIDAEIDSLLYDPTRNN